MNNSYKSALAAIECMYRLHDTLRVDYPSDAGSTASIENTSSDSTDPDALTTNLAAQLQASVIALESKQGDATIGISSSSLYYSLLRLTSSPTSTVCRGTGMAGDLRSSQEHFRSHINIPSKLLEDFSQLHGW